jgi:two-component system, chemotaxis family, sensor kinase CheA
MARDPRELSLLVELLGVCLQEVDELSREAGPHGQEGASLLRNGLNSLRDLLEHENDPECWMAAVDARDALGRSIRGSAGSDPSMTGSGPTAPSNPPAIAEQSPALALDELNKIAALMVRLEPTDLEPLGQVAESLRVLAEDSLLSEAVRAEVGQAAQGMLTLSQATAEDPVALFQQIAGFMDSAADALHEDCVAFDMGAEKGEAASGQAGTDAPPRPVMEPKPATAASEATPPAPAAAAAVKPAPVEKPAPAATPEHCYTAADLELPADADTSLLSEFVNECRDYIEKSEASLLTLETDPEHPDAVNTVFRAFHTIKGTSGFLGIRLISDLAHLAENLFSRVRDKEIRCTGGYADLALRSADTMKVLIDGVHNALAGGPLTKPDDYEDLLRVLRNPEAAGVSAEAGVVEGLPPPATEAQADAPPAGSAEEAAVDAGTAPAEPKAAAPPDPNRSLRSQKRPAGAAEGTDTSVRVRTDRLDRLIDMVGELVIAQSMVAQDEVVRNDHKQELLRKVTHAGKIVRELQDLSMSMRMVPLKPTFQKMARLVRDLAHKSGKQVEFMPSGEETEIDRNMVDVVGDPLVHMIRNSMDHGIELPEDRTKKGKNAAGRVDLSAFHAGGNVVVELTDDGRGLDREKIVRKAIERGLIESDKGMSDPDVYNLIFEPGFSTADKITEVSGRGVGMDVVKRAIQSLHGRVEITSRLGHGTTFSVRLPLTLAITDGMLIRVGEQRFILPTVSIHMSFRPDASSIFTVTGKGEMVMLRKKLVPLIRLHRLFGIHGAVEDPTDALLVIVDEGGRRSGLLVDELLGQQQVVAKSLGDAMGKVAGVSGGAILGDGRVGLILDPGGLAALARGGLTTGEHTALLDLMAA